MLISVVCTVEYIRAVTDFVEHNDEYVHTNTESVFKRLELGECNKLRYD